MVFAFAGDSTTTSAFAISCLFTLARSVKSHEPAAAGPPHQPLQFQLEQPRQQPRRTSGPIARQIRPDRTVRPARQAAPAPGRRAASLIRTRSPAAEVHAADRPSSSKISSAVSTIFAPSRNSACPPRLRPLSTLPGTASTSRPCSSAHRAVISDPLFSPASIDDDRARRAR